MYHNPASPKHTVLDCPHPMDAEGITTKFEVVQRRHKEARKHRQNQQQASEKPRKLLGDTDVDQMVLQVVEDG